MKRSEKSCSKLSSKMPSKTDYTEIYKFVSKFSAGKVLHINCGNECRIEELKTNPKIEEVVVIDGCTVHNKEGTNNNLVEVSYHIEKNVYHYLSIAYGSFDTIIFIQDIYALIGNLLFIEDIYNLLSLDGSFIFYIPIEQTSSPDNIQFFHSELLKTLNAFQDIAIYGQNDSTIELQSLHGQYYSLIAICKK